MTYVDGDHGPSEGDTAHHRAHPANVGEARPGKDEQRDGKHNGASNPMVQSKSIDSQHTAPTKSDESDQLTWVANELRVPISVQDGHKAR